jgi:hypothetical protein
MRSSKWGKNHVGCDITSWLETDDLKIHRLNLSCVMEISIDFTLFFFPSITLNTVRTTCEILLNVCVQYLSLWCKCFSMSSGFHPYVKWSVSTCPGPVYHRVVPVDVAVAVVFANVGTYTDDNDGDADRRAIMTTVVVRPVIETILDVRKAVIFLVGLRSSSNKYN